MEPAEAAKSVFINFRQLEELLKHLAGTSQANPLYMASRVVDSSVPNYNAILQSLKECFRIDPSFAERVAHLEPLDPKANTWDLLEQLKADGVTLRGAAHAFVEVYLSPEEKKRTIGFHS